MKQYLLFWLKTKCLKCYTMYNTLLINKLLSNMQATWANVSIENIKWHIFWDFCCCCNANLYSRMADKLYKGSNSSTFNNVSIDIGVIGMQGKATETRKTNIDNKNKTKKKHTFKSHLKKKRFYVNLTEMYMAFDCQSHPRFKVTGRLGNIGLAS